MSEPALVLGVGARGALGLDARQLALAGRAGWLMPRRTMLGDPPPAGAAPEDGGDGSESVRGLAVGTAFSRALADDVDGPARALRLAVPALEEAVADATELGLDPSLLDRPWPMALALPEQRVDDGPAWGRPFQDALGEHLRGGIDARRSDLVRGGHAGFAAALKRAIERVASAGKEPFAMIVGAADSYAHRSLLADLDQRRRLLSGRAVDGFVPGEAAAFAVLGNAAACGGRASLRILDAVVGQQRDEDDEAATVGEAMTDLVRHLAGAVPDGRFGWVLADLNPERHRQKEWSFVELRHRERMPPSDTALLRLGELYGDLGAASGAVALAIAAVGFRTGFAPGRPALVTLASERGERGAFVTSDMATARDMTQRRAT
jgi:3-oxoacyl-[acyl-carrier-protein] synthase-1